MKRKYRLHINGNFEGVFIQRDELKKHISKRISKCLDEEERDIVDIRIIRFEDENQRLSNFGVRNPMRKHGLG